MTDLISEPNFESQSIENFLPGYMIDNLKKTYNIAQKSLHKKVGNHAKLTEVFLPLKGGAKYLTQICYATDCEATFEDVISTPGNINKYNSRLRRMIERAFEIKKQKVAISRLCIHNLHSPLAIHCDGVDITNKYDNRPKDMSAFTEKNRPILDYNMFNQGLITLQNDNPYNGTVVFDQWFPVSTYILQTVPYNQKILKPMIKFFKDEQWSRFGEKVRHNTHAPLSETDWLQLCEAVEDPGQLNREEFFGLSLDKILHFGKPGTCSVWANKKYHASLPTEDWSKKSIRLNLQFETYFK